MKKIKVLIRRLPISILAITMCLGLDLTVLGRGGEFKDVQGNLSQIRKAVIELLPASGNSQPPKNLSNPLTALNAPKLDRSVEDINSASMVSEEPIVLLLCGVMLFAGGLTVRRKFFNSKN